MDAATEPTWAAHSHPCERGIRASMHITYLRRVL